MILTRLSPQAPTHMQGEAYRGLSKLRMLLGDAACNSLVGKTVVDFGCGAGSQAVEMAQLGARHVYGIDVQEHFLAMGRQSALEAGVQDRCSFLLSADVPPGLDVDRVVSVDAFEHFADPASILSAMHELLAPGGTVEIAFGPTWFHPLGGHLFSVFPWAHLIFSERALIAWRSRFKTDGATRFSEVAGGLNQMTIARFQKLVAGSGFTLEDIQCVPIRRLRGLHNRWTREFTTAIVRARLRRPRDASIR